MDKSQAVMLVALAIPNGMEADKNKIADAAIDKAVLKIGRTPNVPWNRQAVTFSLTSGTSSYKCGADILASFADLQNIESLWCTDAPDHPINIVSLQEFNAHARGSTTSGRPVVATIHSEDETIEFWPIPSSAYTVWGYIQNEITAYEKIPSSYHDVVVDMAITSIRATVDPAIAVQLLKAGLDDIAASSLTKWTGNTIQLSRHLGDVQYTRRADSGNLRGD